MNDTEENIGKTLLAFCALTLAACSCYLIFISAKYFNILKKCNISQDVKNLFPDQNELKGEDALLKIRLVFQSNLEMLQVAQQQTVLPESGQSRSLFAPPTSLCKNGRLIDLSENSDTLHPPIPNSWIIKYHLDYARRDLLEADLKGDGFTVLENYRTNTHPTDKAVHAPPYIKLRLKEHLRVPFHVEFKGSPDGGRIFAVNTTDASIERTHFLKLGDSLSIGDTPYVLEDYRKKVWRQSHGVEKDISELIVRNGKKVRVFIFDQQVNFPRSYAVFKVVRENEEIKVREGEIFALSQWKEHRYQLLEIAETHAIVRSLTTAEKHRIPQLAE